METAWNLGSWEWKAHHGGMEWNKWMEWSGNGWWIPVEVCFDSPSLLPSSTLDQATLAVALCLQASAIPSPIVRHCCTVPGMHQLVGNIIGMSNGMRPPSIKPEA